MDNCLHVKTTNRNGGGAKGVREKERDRELVKGCDLQKQKCCKVDFFWSTVALGSSCNSIILTVHMYCQA